MGLNGSESMKAGLFSLTLTECPAHILAALFFHCILHHGFWGYSWQNGYVSLSTSPSKEAVSKGLGPATVHGSDLAVPTYDPFTKIPFGKVAYQIQLTELARD